MAASKSSKPVGQAVIEIQGRKITAGTIAKAKDDISSAAGLIHSLLDHLREEADHEASVPMMEAAAEKAGWLCDKALFRLGERGGVCGDFEGWSNCGNDDEQEHGGEVAHG